MPVGDGREQDLGFSGAFSIGIGGIVGGGIFATIGIAVAEARGSAPLSFVVGGVVALLTAYSYSRLSLTFPDAGGTVAFVNRGFGFGYVAASLNTLLVFSYAVIMALYANAFATYAASLLPAREGALRTELIAAGVLVLFALLNARRAEQMERIEAALNAVKLAVLGAFVLLGLTASGMTAERLGPAEWVAPPDIFVTGMLVFLSYEGFELIANASPRVQRPARNLPLAFFGSITLAMALYVAIVAVAVGRLPFEVLEAKRSYALAAVAETFMGSAGFVVMALGAVVAAASAINADFYGSTRLVAMLAESGPAPWRRAGVIWGGHPWQMILITVVAVLSATLLDLHALSAVSSAGFLLVFAAVNASNLRLARETASVRWVSGIGVMACLGALGAMLSQAGGQRAHRHEVFIIAALAVAPFVYRAGDRAVRMLRRRLRTKT